MGYGDRSDDLFNKIWGIPDEVDDFLDALRVEEEIQEHLFAIRPSFLLDSNAESNTVRHSLEIRLQGCPWVIVSTDNRISGFAFISPEDWRKVSFLAELEMICYDIGLHESFYVKRMRSVEYEALVNNLEGVLLGIIDCDMEGEFAKSVTSVKKENELIGFLLTPSCFFWLMNIEEDEWLETANAETHKPGFFGQFDTYVHWMKPISKDSIAENQSDAQSLSLDSESKSKGNIDEANQYEAILNNYEQALIDSLFNLEASLEAGYPEVLEIILLLERHPELDPSGQKLEYWGKVFMESCGK